MASKQISGKPERYFVKNGSLFANSDYRSQNVLVNDVADLQRIKNDLEPGCIAHYAGRKDWFELGPDHQWYSGMDDGAIVWSAALDGENTTELFTKYATEMLEADPEIDRYEMLDKWFEMLQDGWAGRYYTLRYENALLDTATGDPTMTPMGDLKGKSPAPCCTDADEDFFHWMDEDPMYWYVRFNALSKQDGTMDILAIEGIDDTFDITGELGPVYTGSMALWVANYILGNYEYKTIATKNDGKLRPLACDVAPDGEPRHMSWHATFGGGIINRSDQNLPTLVTSGAYRSIMATTSISNKISHIKNWDEYEGSYSDTDADHLIWMWQFRHFSLTNWDVLVGITFGTSTAKVKHNTEDTDYFLFSDSIYNSNDMFPIGGWIKLSRFTIQGQTETISVTTFITNKELVEIDGTTYTKLSVSLSGLKCNALENVTSMSTSSWGISGSTEKLPLHKDGKTLYKSPIRIAGIECCEGYDVLCLDPLVLLEKDPETNIVSYKIYACKNSEYQSLTLNDNYEKSIDSLIFVPTSSSNVWINHFKIRNDGILEPDSYKNRDHATYQYARFSAGTFYANQLPIVLPSVHFGSQGDSSSGLFRKGFLHIQFLTNVSNVNPRLGGCGKKRGIWNGFKKSVA